MTDDRAKLRRRPTGLELARRFKAGASFVGLARRYAMTSLEVQNAIRRWCKRLDRKR